MPFWKRSDRTPSTSTPRYPSGNIPHRSFSQVNRRHELPNDFVQPHSQPQQTSQNTTFLSRGEEYFNQGDYARAIFMYDEALRLDPQNIHMLLQLARARTMADPPQLDEASRNVNTVIELENFNGNAWKLKGDIYSMKDDYAAAEEALVQAMGMLQGHARFEAQQALASVRRRKSESLTTTHTQSSNQSRVTETPSPISPAGTPATLPSIVTTPLPAPLSVSPQSQSRVQSQTSNIVPGSQQPQPPNQQTHSLVTPIANSTTPASNTLLAPPGASPTQATATTGSASPSQTPVAPSMARPTTPNIYAQGEVLAQQLDIPIEAPPSYSTASQSAFSGAFTPASSTTSQISTFGTALATKRTGSVYLRPYTMAGQVDAVQMYLYGKNYLQSIITDLPVQPPGAHASWKNYFVSPLSFPGTNFIDYDCESTASYEGHHTGTISVLGYTEEYRERQLAAQVQLQLTLEGTTTPPVQTIQTIVQRIQLLQGNPTLEDNAGLDRILGQPPAVAGTLTSKAMVEDICMSYNRARRDTPTRFIDFLTTASFSKHLFGLGGIGLTNFLFLILMGAELAIRTLRLGCLQKYPNVMTTQTSALIVVARQWMENVTIRHTIGSRYLLVANQSASQVQGLLQFGEAIQWPYLDEARQHLNQMYARLMANPANVPDYLKDWLFGLVLPGKFFRHRILSCLALACPSTQALSYAPYYDSGLIVGNKSYWPKRSVLGRVLGGLRNPKLTCGWIGPVPSPIGIGSSWILLYATKVNFTTPALDDLTQTNLELLGFEETEANLDPLGLVRDISDVSKWIPPRALPARPSTSTALETGTASQVRLSAIRLTEVTIPSATARYHRATLDFSCCGKSVSFVLYSNPVFVHVPRCEGVEHPIHERLVKKLFTGLILAKDLKNAVPASTTALTIIDATEPGEEAMARAWCAETSRHAVVRKNGIGCFTCATNLAMKRSGLGFNVLIWCK